MLKLSSLLPLLLLAAACHTAPADTAAPLAATATQEPQDRDVEDPAPGPAAPIAATGRISGKLSFPSDYIPEDMQVVAVPVRGGPEISDFQRNKDYTYSMELPVGEYYVYAITSEDPGHKAYYNEFVTCGLNVNCPSHTIIKVPVRAGQTTPNIDPGDWYDRL